jgi:hypothetical protein
MFRRRRAVGVGAFSKSGPLKADSCRWAPFGVVIVVPPQVYDT